jgi:copper homeostasis protein
MICKEACVESLEECRNAVNNGASQLELCAELEVGGLTPDLELVKQAAAMSTAPVKIMIRNCVREKFVHSEEDVEQMLQSIGEAKRIGVFGVVFGACKLAHRPVTSSASCTSSCQVTEPQLQLDYELIKRLTEAAKPELNVTIHKCIDLTNVEAEVKQLMQMEGVDCVLTSGGCATALEGAATLRRLVELTRGHTLRIIAAGRVTRDNFDEIHDLIGAKLYHGRRIV